MSRYGQHRAGGTLFYDVPAIHHSCPAGTLAHHVQIVTDQEQDHLLAYDRVAKQIENLRP